MWVANHFPADEHSKQHTEPRAGGDEREDPVRGPKRQHLEMYLCLSNAVLFALFCPGDALESGRRVKKAKP